MATPTRTTTQSLNPLQGTLISHGAAPYRNDPANTQSYFVELANPGQQNRFIWGVGLEEALANSNIEIGQDISLMDLGVRPVEVPDPKQPGQLMSVNRRTWDIELYERPIELVNSIEPDFSQEQKIEQKPQPLQTEKEEIFAKTNSPNYQTSLVDVTEDYPSNVKNNYAYRIQNKNLLDEKVNFYDKTDPEKIAFEDRKNGLHTSREDEKTIHAMLDLAQSKGWGAINIKGTEEFKRQAWLEASIRGVEVKGYKPSEKDLIALQIAQESRMTNEVHNDKARSAEIAAQAPKEPVAIVPNPVVEPITPVFIPNPPTLVEQYRADPSKNQSIDDRTLQSAEKLAQDMVESRLEYDEVITVSSPDGQAMVQQEFDANIQAHFEDRAMEAFEDQNVEKYLDGQVAQFDGLEQNPNMSIEQSAEIISIDPAEQALEAALNAQNDRETVLNQLYTQEPSSEKNIRFTISDIAVNDIPEGYEGMLVNGVHIRDNETGENYQLLNLSDNNQGYDPSIPLEQVPDGEIYTTALYYQNDAEYELANNTLLVDQDKIILSKLGITDQSKIPEIRSFAQQFPDSGATPVNKSAIDVVNSLRPDQLNLVIGKQEVWLSNDLTKVVLSGREAGFTKQEEGRLVAEIMDFHSDYSSTMRRSEFDTTQEKAEVLANIVKPIIKDERFNDFIDKYAERTGTDLSTEKRDISFEEKTKENRFFTPEDEKTLTHKVLDNTLSVGIAGVATGGLSAGVIAGAVVANELHNHAIDKIVEVKDYFSKDKNNEKVIEKESLIQAENYNHTPSLGQTADVEVFHEHLTIPNIPGMSTANITSKMEAAFDKKIDTPPAYSMDDIQKLPDGVRHSVESAYKLLMKDPATFDEKWSQLSQQIPDMDAGRIQSPNRPIEVQTPQINIQTPQQGNRDRGR